MIENNYEYSKQLKTPNELGMSTSGSVNALSKNITGLIEYTKVLASGNSKASQQKYLGNKYFFNTGGSCYDEEGNKQERYVYIDNVPYGNIPFISDSTDTNFKEFRGLVPGAISQLNNMNPSNLISGLKNSSSSKCMKIEMEVIDGVEKPRMESNYVAYNDIEGLSPCSFKDGINPITKEKCKMGFTNYYYNEENQMIFLCFSFFVFLLSLMFINIIFMRFRRYGL